MDSSSAAKADTNPSSQQDSEWPKFPPGEISNSTYIPPPIQGFQAAPAPCAPLLLLDNADTLVFIDAPPQRPSSSTLPSSNKSIPHRIHSKTLLETGSAYFAKLFSPRIQARVIKQRGLAEWLVDGIKYAIDLTPPTEGEEAVLTITELSCPLGIRTWARAQHRWKLPPSCVGGEDEVEWLGTDASQKTAEPRREQDSEAEEVTVESRSDKVEPKAAKWPETSIYEKLERERKNSGLPLDYSPVRHRAGIEQILQALEGFHPRLDTPCKLWTFFALAKLYGIATVPKICDLILSWFYESTNVFFLEIHPEIGYQIACGVQCASLCRDTFAILVGEEALLLLANSDKPATLRRPQETWHGRLRESLDDTELQRIEYASKSFLDYVMNRFVNLMGADMAWLHRLPEFQKVYHYQPRTAREQESKDRLLTCLKDSIRSTLLSTVSGNYCLALLQGPPIISEVDDEGYPSKRFIQACKDMPPAFRILWRAFWRDLVFEYLKDSHAKHTSVIASLAKHIPPFMEREDWKTQPVSSNELRDKVQDFNSFYGSSVDGSPSQNASPPQPARNALGSGFSSTSQQRDVWNRDPFSRAVDGFDLDAFLDQVRSYTSNYSKQMTMPCGPRMVYELTDTLTCLTDNEFKYLPLWAGGNDDGSGGVFIDHNIPVMETGGFSAPGPAIHTGSTAASPDSYSVIAPTEADSTAQGASHRATESHNTEVMSISTESGIDSDHGPGWQTADDDGFDFSSADDDAVDFDSDSDSTGTAVMGPVDQDDLVSDFEEVHLSDNASPSH